VFPDIFIIGTYKVTLTDKNNVQSGFGEADPVSETPASGSTIAKFANIVEMKATKSVSVGDLVETAGSVTAGDIGAATYLVETLGSPDGFADHASTGVPSVQFTLLHDGYVTDLQIGGGAGLSLLGPLTYAKNQGDLQVLITSAVTVPEKVTLALTGVLTLINGGGSVTHSGGWEIEIDSGTLIVEDFLPFTGDRTTLTANGDGSIRFNGGTDHSLEVISTGFARSVYKLRPLQSGFTLRTGSKVSAVGNGNKLTDPGIFNYVIDGSAIYAKESNGIRVQPGVEIFDTDGLGAIFMSSCQDWLIDNAHIHDTSYRAIATAKDSATLVTEHGEIRGCRFEDMGTENSVADTHLEGGFKANGVGTNAVFIDPADAVAETIFVHHNTAINVGENFFEGAAIFENNEGRESGNVTNSLGDKLFSKDTGAMFISGDRAVARYNRFTRVGNANTEQGIGTEGRGIQVDPGNEDNEVIGNHVDGSLRHSFYANQTADATVFDGLIMKENLATDRDSRDALSNTNFFFADTTPGQVGFTRCVCQGNDAFDKSTNRLDTDQGLVQRSNGFYGSKSQAFTITALAAGATVRVDVAAGVKPNDITVATFDTSPGVVNDLTVDSRADTFGNIKVYLTNTGAGPITQAGTIFVDVV
jgi:hypothetical protein